MCLDNCKFFSHVWLTIVLTLVLMVIIATALLKSELDDNGDLISEEMKRCTLYALYSSLTAFFVCILVIIMTIVQLFYHKKKYILGILILILVASVLTALIIAAIALKIGWANFALHKWLEDHESSNMWMRIHVKYRCCGSHGKGHWERTGNRDLLKSCMEYTRGCYSPLYNYLNDMVMFTLICLYISCAQLAVAIICELVRTCMDVIKNSPR